MSENSININAIRFDRDFTIISNSTFHDENLTIGARGLLAYLLTCPPNWKIHTWQLAKIYSGKKKGNGLDAIKELMKELRQQGYIRYSKSKDDKGLWIHNYQIYPIPFKDFQKIYPERDHPAVDHPAVVNPSLTTNNELTNNELNVCVVPDNPAVRYCEVITSSKGKVKFTYEDLMSKVVLERKDWIQSEIEAAWEIICKYGQPVNDWFHFIDGTIKKIRLKQNNTKQMEKKCHKDSDNIKTSMKPLERRKDFYSANDTSERPLAILARQLGLR